MEMIPLSAQPTHQAPGGMEIRPPSERDAGGLTHCLLPPGCVRRAARYKTVDELRYFLSGHGEIWRTVEEPGLIDSVGAGSSLVIPKGTSYQVRNTGEEPLCLIVATIPRWPGPQEAETVIGPWTPTERQLAPLEAGTGPAHPDVRDGEPARERVTYRGNRSGSPIQDGTGLDE